LLHSLDIDNQMRGPIHGPYPEMEEYWKQSQSTLRSAPTHNAADNWVAEFGRQSNSRDDWAHSFEQQFGPNGWASEFEKVRSLEHAYLSFLQLSYYLLSTQFM
jgi:peroxin-5